MCIRDSPNTIPAVIFDRKHDVQFTPVSNGTVYLPPTAKSVEAAKRVLNGENTAGKALYFYAPAPVSYTHLDVYKRQGVPQRAQKGGL